MYQCFGHIKDGKLKLSNKKRFEDEISKWDDCIVELTIRKKNRRSTQQNRYLFGIVYKEIEIRMKELGNDVNVEVVHEFCKERFNLRYIIGPGGEMIGTIGGSTTDMNKEEFSIYIEKIIKFAAETLEITIPFPNEKLKLNF